MTKKRKTITILISLVMVLIPFTNAIASCCHSDQNETNPAVEIDPSHHAMMIEKNNPQDDSHENMDCHCVMSALVTNIEIASDLIAQTEIAVSAYLSFTDITLSLDSPPPKS